MIDKQRIYSILKANDNFSKQVLIGFDGFVDEICQVVEERISVNYYKPIQTITDYAKKIAKYANLSINMELVPLLKKIGGNAPIMANALIQLDNSVDFIGAIGKENINPIFVDFAQKCRNCYSLTDPGHTDALEFIDGKIMLGKVHQMNEVCWDRLLLKIGSQKLLDICQEANLIAFTNWTLILGMNRIISEFINLLETTKHQPYLFFDLSDPTKRDPQDLRELLFYLEKLKSVGKVILGLNQNESKLVAQLLKIDTQDLPTRALLIQKKIGAYVCVIHNSQGATCSYEDQSFWCDSTFTPQPKISTGAGDNFNAGFCHGILMGLNPVDSLLVGISCSGFYVREKHSPNPEELNDFIINSDKKREV